MRKSIRSIVSVALSFVYFSGQIALGSSTESNFWAERRRVSAAHSQSLPKQLASLPMSAPTTPPNALLTQLPSIKTIIPSDAGTLSPTLSPKLRRLISAIPFIYGSLGEIYDGGESNASPVLLIQDVHLNSEAQSNVSSVLQELIDQRQLGMVGVEGAFNAFDFTPLRNVAEKSQVADFLQKNLIAAPSYVGITSAIEPPPFIGVDDPAHYDSNLDALFQSQDQKARVQKKLAELERTIAASKAASFSKEVSQLDSLRTSYRRGYIGFGVYVKQFAAYSEEHEWVIDQFLAAYQLENSLDFKLVEIERKNVIEKLTKALDQQQISDLLSLSLGYRTGRVGFGAYYQSLKSLCEKKGVRLTDTPHFDNYIRYVLLSDGIKAEKLLDAVDNMERAVFTKMATEQEKRILARSNTLALAEKLIDFSLTPKEWQKYQAAKLDVASLDLTAFEKFYMEADARSHLMVANLTSHTTESAKAFILGGFHSPEVAQLLRAKKISYVIVSPKLTKIDSATGSSYLSVFAREKTPLQKLFAGEKLFINPASRAAIGSINGRTIEEVASLAHVKPEIKKAAETEERLGVHRRFQLKSFLYWTGFAGLLIGETAFFQGGLRHLLILWGNSSVSVHLVVGIVFTLPHLLPDIRKLLLNRNNGSKGSMALDALSIVKNGILLMLISSVQTQLIQQAGMAGFFLASAAHIFYDATIIIMRNLPHEANDPLVYRVLYQIGKFLPLAAMIRVPMREEDRGTSMEPWDVSSTQLNLYRKQIRQPKPYAEDRINLLPHIDATDRLSSDEALRVANTTKRFLNDLTDSKEKDLLARLLGSETFAQAIITRTLQRLRFADNGDVDLHAVAFYLRILAVRIQAEVDVDLPTLTLMKMGDNSLQFMARALSLKSPAQESSPELLSSFSRILNEPSLWHKSYTEGLIRRIGILTHNRDGVLSTVEDYAENIIGFGHTRNHQIEIVVLDDSNDVGRPQRETAIREMTERYADKNLRITYYGPEQRKKKIEKIAEIDPEAVSLSLGKGAGANRNWASLLGIPVQIDDDVKPWVITKFYKEDPISVPIDFLQILNQSTQIPGSMATWFVYSGNQDIDATANLTNDQVAPSAQPADAIHLFDHSDKQPGLQPRSQGGAFYSPHGEIPFPPIADRYLRMEDLFWGYLASWSVNNNPIFAAENRFYVPSIPIQHDRDSNGRTQDGAIAAINEEIGRLSAGVLIAATTEVSKETHDADPADRIVALGNYLVREIDSAPKGSFGSVLDNHPDTQQHLETFVNAMHDIEVFLEDKSIDSEVRAQLNLAYEAHVEIAKRELRAYAVTLANWKSLREAFADEAIGVNELEESLPNKSKVKLENWSVSIAGLIRAIDARNNSAILNAVENLPSLLSLHVGETQLPSSEHGAMQMADVLLDPVVQTAIKDELGDLDLKQWNEGQKNVLLLALGSAALQDQKTVNEFMALLIDSKKTPVFVLSGDEKAEELASVQAFVKSHPTSKVYLRANAPQTRTIEAQLGNGVVTRYVPTADNIFDVNNLGGVTNVFIVKPTSIDLAGDLGGIEVLKLEDIFPILHKSLDANLKAAVAALISA